jgi:hypothetical protein
MRHGLKETDRFRVRVEDGQELGLIEYTEMVDADRGEQPVPESNVPTVTVACPSSAMVGPAAPLTAERPVQAYSKGGDDQSSPGPCRRPTFPRMSLRLPRDDRSFDG